MKTEQDVRLWLAEWAKRECFPGHARHDCIYRVWRSYWRLCARNGRAPLPVHRWAMMCAAVTAGAVEAWQHEGEARLLSENREAVRDALRNTAIAKLTALAYRTVAR
jgi:hypothetical protein